MLLSWRNALRNQVVLAIYPDRVVWLRVAAGLRKRITAKGVVPCAVDNGTPWRGALAVLPEVLRAAQATAMPVAVLLSNRLLRYAISPNPDSARNRAELDLLTRHVFQRTHGDIAAGWDIRLSDAAPGQPALASAVDRELVEALRDVIAAAGGRLVSLQPYLMAVFNQLGRALPDRGGIFVLAEPERLCLLAWKAGGWCGVQQVHAEHDWATSLPGMLNRLVITAGLQEVRALRLCAPELGDQKFGAQSLVEGGWQIEMARPDWPAGLAPIQDRVFAGAMLALS